MSAARSASTTALRDRRRIRLIGALVAGIVFSACIASFVVVASISTNDRSLLLGTVTGFQIQLAVTGVGLLALAALLLLVTRRWWLVAAAPVAFVSVLGATGAFLLGSLAATDVTPLTAEGCTTNYVAIEQLGGGDAVYRQDGVFVTPVASIVTDDFVDPFTHDAYVTRTNGDSLDVWYNPQTAFAKPPTSGPPSFSLPLEGVLASCE